MYDELKKIFEKHHAIVLESLRERAHEIFSQLKDEHDVFFLDKDDISIDDANSIKENANLRANLGQRVIIVSTNKFGREAEHALLKILEEPPVGTKIIFITPNSKMFSPTILSRVAKVKIESDRDTNQALDFLKKDVFGRQKKVDEFLKSEDFDLVLFLSKIEEVIKSRDLASDNSWRSGAVDILESKKALQISGTSKKQIFEYLALTLPKI